MADFLPPVVVEVILRSQGFSEGAAKVKAEVAGMSDGVSASTGRMAADVDKNASKVEQRSAAMSKKVGGAMQALAGSLGVIGGPIEKTGERMAELEGKADSLTGKLATVGKVATLGGLAGFAASAYEGVKAATSFQSAVAHIADNADETQKAAQGIGNAFLGSMGKSIFSAQQMAEAFASVAGQLKLTEGHALSAADATKVMAAASDLAEGAHTSLAQSTAALSTVMQAYHLSVGQAAGAGDTLFNVSRAMNIGIDQVATGVNKLHGRLGALAPSLKDTSAMMVELGQHGITGTRGVSVATTALQTLVGNSKQTTAVLSALGVHIFDSSGKFIGLQSVIGQLQPKLAGLTQQQQFYAEKTLFGASAAQVMSQIIQGGVPQFEAAAAAASKAGTAQNSAAINAKTLHNQVELLKATVEDLGIKFGTFLIPKLEAAGQAISSVIGWMGKHKGAAEALAITIGSVLGLAITVFAYTKAVAFVGATKDMIGGLGRFASSVASSVPGILAKLGLISSTSATTAGEVAAESGAMETSITGLGTITAEQATSIDASLARIAAAFPALDAAVTEGVTVADAQMSLFADTVATEGAAIEATNVEVGASFTAMLGPIGLVAAALGGVTYALANTPANPGPAQWQSIVSKGPGAQGRFNGMTGSLPGQPNSVTGGMVPVPGSGIGGMSLSTVMGNAPTATGPGGVWLGAGGQVTPTSFAASVLSRLGIKGTTANIQDFTAWEQQEGGNWNNSAKYNPLNTTLGEPGAGNTGSQGNIKVYTSWAQGLQATVDTLKKYPTILAALKSGAPLSQFSSTVAGSPWGTGAINAPGVAVPNSQLAALMNPTAAGTSKTAAAKAIKELLYTNPLPGMTSVGRQDMGLDFSATPGSAVNAMGAGKITDIIANWYKGQPLVEEQLSSGPNAGKFVYYAEQLNSLVKQGQSVAAGQRIGTVAPSGTGLELGFGGPNGQTLAQSQGGQWAANPAPGQKTPWGTAFQSFFGQASKGVYQTVTGGTVTGGGANSSLTLAQAMQQFTTQISTQANSLVTKLGNLMQSAGSPAMMEKTLGVSTAGGVAGHLQKIIGGANIAQIEQALNAGQSPTALDKSLIPTLAKASAKSPQAQQMAQLVAELQASGLTGLANEVKAQWGAALSTLAQSLTALQLTKNAESLKLQATQETDRTKLTGDLAKAQLQVVTDSQDLVVEQMTAAATQIKDTTAVITSQFGALATSIQDATQLMADSSNARVQGVHDQTQTQVDILGEKGLYGLGLIAQQETVQLDVMKTGFDQQIAAAQANVDATKAQWDATIASLQVQADQTQLQQDQLLAAAQQAETMVQLHQDTLVQTATAHADTVALASDLKVTLAQQTVDLSASAPAAQQKLAQAMLTHAQAQQAVQEAAANATLSTVQNTAAVQENAAQNTYNLAQQTAAQQEAAAQQALAQAQGQGAVQEAYAAQALQTVQDTAAQQEAAAQAQIDVTSAQQAALQRGGGTFDPYSTLLLGAGGALNLIGGGGPLPFAGAYSAGGEGGGAGGGHTTVTQQINLQSSADPSQLASEMLWLLKPYLAIA